MAEEGNNHKRLEQILLTLTLVCITALVSFVSQIILHPVYGGGATGLHHNEIVFVASFTPLIIASDRFVTQQWRATAFLLMCTPLYLPMFFSFSGVWGPVWGPVLTQAVLTWPCVFFASHAIHRTVNRGRIASVLSAAVLTTFIRYSHGFLTAHFLPLIGVVWSRFSILVYLGLFAGFIDIIPLLKRREFLTVLFTFAVLVPLALFVLNRPHVLPGVTDGLIARLPAEYTYLARQESLTGMITVVENSEVGYRVLKCDHSLLGGLWTGIKRRELVARGLTEDLDFKSVHEADSVYTAFYLQEAARLTERKTRDSQYDKVLIMYQSPF
jgi:hypothetical protein